MIETPPEVCDTEENEVARVEKWWTCLKEHMDLSTDEDRGRASDDPQPTPLQDLPDHSDEQVQRWEEE